MTAAQKNILITPNIGNTTALPSIVYTGNANYSMTQFVAEDNSVFWSNPTGQLFSIGNNVTTGTIFSVTDISGIPFISVNASGNISLMPFGGGNIGIGTATPGYPLSVQGNVFLNNSVWAGNIAITNATPSTSTTTGALILPRAGAGLGVAGNVYTGNAYITSNVGVGTSDLRASVFRLYANNSTDAFRIRQDGSGNAFVVSDGADDLSPFVIDFSGNVGIGTYPPRYTLDTWGNARITGSGLIGNIAITNINVSTSTGTGVIVVAGGAGIAGNLYVGGNISVSNTTQSTSSLTGALLVAGGAGITGNAFISNAVWAGNITVTNTTVSTSATTGALVLPNAGAGLGVVGNIYVGGNLVISNATASTSNTTGALILAQGGAGITGNAYVNNAVWAGNISITNTNVSTSTGTGVLVVRGGAGIAGNLYVGGNISVSNTTQATSALTGALVVAGGAGITGNAYVSNAVWAGNIAITNTNVSTSTSTGVLVVAGGAGIAGNLYVGGNISVSNTTQATSATTGALVVAGGAGITGNAFVSNSVWAGNIAITNTTVSASSLTGALVVAGGAGIGGNIYTAGNVVISGNLRVGTTAAPASNTVVILANSPAGGGIELVNNNSGGGNIAGLSGGGLSISTFTGAVGSEVYTQRMSIDQFGNSTYTGNITITGGLVPSSSFLRNKIVNGGMQIDQRNVGASQTFTAAAALAYAVDHWYAYCTGANVTGQRVAGSGANQFRYQFTGAASVTAIGFGQRIESFISYDLNNTTATLSVDLANSLLTTVTWTAYYANTADTFGTLAVPTRTQIATGTFTVTSTVTRYSTTIPIPAAATTGIEVVFTVGAQTSGTWTIGAVQLEAGSNATPFERRTYAQELDLCQRYFQKTFPQTQSVVDKTGTTLGALTAPVIGGSVIHYGTGTWTFPVKMRASPSIAFYAPTAFGTGNWVNGANAATSTAAAVNPSDRHAIVYMNSASTIANVTADIYYIHVTASSEL